MYRGGGGGGGVVRGYKFLEIYFHIQCGPQYIFSEW